MSYDDYSLAWDLSNNTEKSVSKDATRQSYPVSTGVHVGGALSSTLATTIAAGEWIVKSATNSYSSSTNSKGAGLSYQSTYVNYNDSAPPNHQAKVSGSSKATNLSKPKQNKFLPSALRKDENATRSNLLKPSNSPNPNFLALTPLPYSNPYTTPSPHSPPPPPPPPTIPLFNKSMAKNPYQITSKQSKAKGGKQEYQPGAIAPLQATLLDGRIKLPLDVSTSEAIAAAAVADLPTDSEISKRAIAKLVSLVLSRATTFEGIDARVRYMEIEPFLEDLLKESRDKNKQTNIQAPSMKDLVNDSDGLLIPNAIDVKSARMGFFSPRLTAALNRHFPGIPQAKPNGMYGGDDDGGGGGIGGGGVNETYAGRNFWDNPSDEGRGDIMTKGDEKREALDSKNINKGKKKKSKGTDNSIVSISINFPFFQEGEPDNEEKKLEDATVSYKSETSEGLFNGSQKKSGTSPFTSASPDSLNFDPSFEPASNDGRQADFGSKAKEENRSKEREDEGNTDWRSKATNPYGYVNPYSSLTRRTSAVTSSSRQSTLSSSMSNSRSKSLSNDMSSSDGLIKGLGSQLGDRAIMSSAVKLFTQPLHLHWILAADAAEKESGGGEVGKSQITPHSFFLPPSLLPSQLSSPSPSPSPSLSRSSREAPSAPSAYPRPSLMVGCTAYAVRPSLRSSRILTCPAARRRLDLVTSSPYMLLERAKADVLLGFDGNRPLSYAGRLSDAASKQSFGNVIGLLCQMPQEVGSYLPQSTNQTHLEATGNGFNILVAALPKAQMGWGFSKEIRTSPVPIYSVSSASDLEALLDLMSSPAVLKLVFQMEQVFLTLSSFQKTLALEYEKERNCGQPRQMGSPGNPMGYSGSSKAVNFTSSSAATTTRTSNDNNVKSNISNDNSENNIKISQIVNRKITIASVLDLKPLAAMMILSNLPLRDPRQVFNTDVLQQRLFDDSDAPRTANRYATPVISDSDDRMDSAGSHLNKNVGDNSAENDFDPIETAQRNRSDSLDKDMKNSGKNHCRKDKKSVLNSSNSKNSVINDSKNSPKCELKDTSLSNCQLDASDLGLKGCGVKRMKLQNRPSNIYDMNALKVMASIHSVAAEFGAEEAASTVLQTEAEVREWESESLSKGVEGEREGQQEVKNGLKPEVIEENSKGKSYMLTLKKEKEQKNKTKQMSTKAKGKSSSGKPRKTWLLCSDDDDDMDDSDESDSDDNYNDDDNDDEEDMDQECDGGESVRMDHHRSSKVEKGKGMPLGSANDHTLKIQQNTPMASSNIACTNVSSVAVSSAAATTTIAAVNAASLVLRRIAPTVEDLKGVYALLSLSHRLLNVACHHTLLMTLGLTVGSQNLHDVRGKQNSEESKVGEKEGRMKEGKVKKGKEGRWEEKQEKEKEVEMDSKKFIVDAMEAFLTLRRFKPFRLYQTLAEVEEKRKEKRLQLEIEKEDREGFAVGGEDDVVADVSNPQANASDGFRVNATAKEDAKAYEVLEKQSEEEQEDEDSDEDDILKALNNAMKEAEKDAARKAKVAVPVNSTGALLGLLGVTGYSSRSYRFADYGPTPREIQEKRRKEEEERKEEARKAEEARRLKVDSDDEVEREDELACPSQDQEEDDVGSLMYGSGISNVAPST
eukprot:CAMPEP_0175049602 /NCGR_PEP_ID=MMETSP0052_2-20121109/6815_1 /TAXON_ID=51329 ORGANISM="Polytomella parva, Strain SAG 63-3" /NCGR_SAMPLE_ID=MMETSP0052_2 /ASSEMBLY_ACC=CAM_ASM_000194 /LENGTH=1624 /DNA_ID=CAMNT_0016313753 /DNA_START=113 /DNA_END=4983 /DNA_ORIENTATION=-